MSNQISSFLKLLLISSIFWVLVFLLFTAIRYSGLEDEMHLYTDDELFLPIRTIYEAAIAFGLTISVFYTVIEFLFDRIVKQFILGVRIFLKSIIYFILIVVMVSLTSFHLEEQIDIDIYNTYT